MRQGIIDLVLATDMSKHFVHLNKFVNVFTNSVQPVSRMQENAIAKSNTKVLKIVVGIKTAIHGLDWLSCSFEQFYTNDY
jgi:hypothetical protein